MFINHSKVKLKKRVLDSELIKSYIFRNSPINDSMSTPSYINHSLLLSEIAKKESSSVDKQIKSFEELKDIFQLNKPLIPTKRIYLTNIKQDLYELVSYKEDDEENTYLSEIPFEEFFQPYHKKYSHYKTFNNLSQSLEEKTSNKKLKIKPLSTFDFYKKIRQTKKKIKTTSPKDSQIKKPKKKILINDSLTATNVSNMMKSTQLPTLTETFNTTTSRYKCNNINKSKGNKSIRKKLIPFLDSEKVTPFELNNPFRHRNKVRKEIRLYSLLK